MINQNTTEAREASQDAAAVITVKKATSTVVHAAAEAWDGLHPFCDTTSRGSWTRVDGATVTCKRCLKQCATGGES